MHEADFELADYGSLSILTPLTGEAWRWLEDNIEGEALWYAGGVAVEHRYVDDIVEGIEGDGLTVRPE